MLKNIIFIAVHKYKIKKCKATNVIKAISFDKMILLMIINIYIVV